MRRFLSNYFDLLFYIIIISGRKSVQTDNSVPSVLNVALHCSRLSGLEMFPQLEELVLDSNAITPDVLDSLPQLPRLTVLSLNKNQV